MYLFRERGVKIVVVELGSGVNSIRRNLKEARVVNFAIFDLCIENFLEFPAQKWWILKKCSHEIRFARGLEAWLPYHTLTGRHQVCITRKDDPALRLFTNCGQKTHLFCILGLLHRGLPRPQR